MRYFVTGTAGFIGFHLARLLLARGASVVGYDGLTPYYDVSLKERRHAILAENPRFEPVIGMLEDADTLRRAASEARPDVVVHLAAQAGVRYSLENPRAYIDANLVGSFNLLEVVRDLEVRHLIVASTSSVYGANAKCPFTEVDCTDQPMTLYAASKKAVEAMAHVYAHLHGIPTTAVRFFTVYGPWGRPDMALFKFVSAALRGEAIEVYGEGRMERDFTYVDDLVEAMARLADVVPVKGRPVAFEGGEDSLSPIAPFRIVNIGGGAPVGLLPFIDTIERHLGVRLVRRMLPMQPGDVPRTFASPDLLEALTGYVPQTRVDAGVRAFIDWFRDYQGGLEQAAPNANGRLRRPPTRSRRKLKASSPRPAAAVADTSAA
ncbi:NAD-dependent epimerase/dehydratase family protein [Inquilinus limosus]|uniref:NAD-dependent epimerase/dehydratase family protein n=1 Tax=Inquilinus limosus TaxID=171674 RepID=UPI00042A52F0|nr:NAD-dependent epimerase/dehydratase family protein [Inquilinus limosus]